MRTHPRIAWTVRVMGAFVFYIGTIGLLNWIDGRRNAFPFHSDVTMKTNTAIGVQCLSVAVILLTFSGRAVLLGRGLGLFASLIGFATFCEHLFRIDLHIDQLLFVEAPGAIATTSPNRMGPPASLMFAMLGQIVFWIPDHARVSRNVQWLALVTLAIAIVPLMGFFFGATDLYSISQLTGIAPHTALSTLILSIAVLLLRPNRPPVDLLFRRDAGGEMARRLIPAALLLPPVVGWIVSQGREANWYDIPMARVLMQALLVIPLVGLVWWTARHLSTLAQARDSAQRSFFEARVEAEGLAAQNVETTNLLDRLLDNAPVGFAAFDRSFRYIRVNTYLAEVSGKPLEAHIGKPLRSVYPEQADQFEAMIERAFTTGTSIQNIESSYRSLTDPEIERHFNCELFPVLGRDGSVSLVGLVAIDVTERKRLDAQRAAILENERNARIESERAGLLKDEFLATLSHELRTPLTAIVGWAQILRRKTPDPIDLNRGLETIDRNGKSLSQLINDLLDVSSIINGKMHLNMMLINVQSIAAAAIDSVMPSAETRGITLLKSFDEEPLPVHADPARLQQVVWNLLTNALKFTPRGGTVHVRVRRAQGRAEIVVSDTGCGVKPDFVPFMFERFRQADASTTRRFGGLGLGLSIVRQLTELHGGTVRVASDGIDRGATFTVSLPLAKAPAPLPDPDLATANDHSLLEGVRVLVVDDEADSRDLVAQVIEQTGASVSRASSADEALLRVELDNPQILITDIGMPDKDGYELIRMLRSQRSAADLPAMALTAFARPEDKDRSLSAGFQLHIHKPVSPKELVQATISLLPKRKPPGST